MNSSGIKRGLAATAVAALAVTGLPFLASSANAADPASLTVLASGPARNGGDLGALVILDAKNIPASEVGAGSVSTGYAIADLEAQNPSGSTTQSVDVLSARFFGAATGGDGKIVANVKVQTTSLGATANYTIYGDFDSTSGLSVGDPRVENSTTTAGDPASITVSPASQSAAANVFTDDYTATIKDSAGRTTQLNTDEAFDFIGTPGTTSLELRRALPATDGTFSYDAVAAPGTFRGVATQAPMGTIVFKAKDSTATPTSIDIPVHLAKVATDPDTTPMSGDETYAAAFVSAKANLVTVSTATDLVEDEVDVVTSADAWDGFGGGAFGAVPVRVDQGSIKIDIDDDATLPTGTPVDNKNKTVVLTAEGSTGVKIGGKQKTSFTTTLDSAGKGSVTITPDAGTIVEGSTITVTGSGINLVLTFQKSSVNKVTADAKTYVSKIGGSVDVTLTAKDQFGLPATGVYLGALRKDGVNGGASGEAEVKKAVDSNGKATFTFTDTKATANGTNTADNVLVRAYADQFAATPIADIDPVTVGNQSQIDVADIVYTASGAGADFGITVDGQPAASPVYDPTAGYATLPPLSDGVDSGDSEDVNVAVAGGTGGAPVTISVDNGALVLPTGKTALKDGQASYSTSLDNSGGISFNVVGTKAGSVNVSVTSAGVTKTTKVTVKAPASYAAAARNLEVTAPEKATANEVVPFTVTVTDAFGNPVAGVDSDDISTLVSGPAHIQSKSAESDENGTITYQVELDNDADSAVTLQVRGIAHPTDNQFGASANYVHDADDNGTPPAAANGPGLTASVNTASDTVEDVVNIADLEQAVADAQDAVDRAQDNLDAAKGDLAVAKAERSVAQKAVKAAKKDLRQAKKHHKGVKAARKALREARGDKRVANAKVSVAQAKVNTATERLADAQAELEAAQQALEDAQK